MFRFANPEAFQLFWLLPTLVGLVVFNQARVRRRLRQKLGDRLTPYLTASVSTARRRWKLALQLLAASCFILALARPQMGKSLQKVKSEGVELMVAIDVSNSMLAEDVKPSRLQHAKAELVRLLDMLSGDKVGIVAFAGSAVLLSPLTSDKSALKMYVESLSPESVESQGTDFRKALRESRQAFERGGVDVDEGARVTRVILLASDGEDNEPGAVDEAKKLLNEGVRIFGWAFGTERGAPIPIRDERGVLRGYKRDRKGQNVMTASKGESLRDLARIGKGSFYHSTYGGGEAKQIKADLDKLEKAEFDADMQTNYDEKYQVFLLLGLILALLEFALGERRGEGRIWKGRFEVTES